MLSFARHIKTHCAKGSPLKSLPIRSSAYMPAKDASHRVKIVSGGQTGVDRGCLDACLEMGVAYGGWCPRSRRAEDGTIPQCYLNLRETDSVEYSVRTEQNVKDSDGTLIFVRSKLFGGTELTLTLAKRHRKAYYIFDLCGDSPSRHEQIQAVTQWIQKHSISTLNCAGPRESDCPGIQAEVRAIFSTILVELGAV